MAGGRSSGWVPILAAAVTGVATWGLVRAGDAVPETPLASVPVPAEVMEGMTPSEAPNAPLLRRSIPGARRSETTHSDTEEVRVVASVGDGVVPSLLAGRTDELLSTTMLDDPSFQREVDRWVRFWATGPTQWFPQYMTRMRQFEDYVDETLAAHDLPWSLRFLPVIESGYSPSAVSSAKAVGMWQFMEPTAKDFGVEVTRFVDDRRDPFESTEAAADFLVRLRDEFDSWFLALAAYNAGPHRIKGIIRRHAPGAEYSDELYWAVRRHLPKETREFVPNLFGAIVVASNPEAYGYEIPDGPGCDFDRVLVFGAISFEGAAEAAGSTTAEIARLNPEYVRGVTPRRRRVDLRLPPGSADRFRTYFEGR